MSVELTHLILYSDRPASLERFWAGVLAGPPTQESRGVPQLRIVSDGGGQGEALHIESPRDGGPSGGGAVLGIRPKTGTLAEEVARLKELGALIVAEEKDSEDLPRVTMSDPDGNQFVLTPSKEERTDWMRIREAESEETTSGIATAIILMPDEEVLGNGDA